MARGWESKAIESQLEDRANARKPAKRTLTAEERARTHELDGLLMSRANLERELSLTKAPVRRAALEDALGQISSAIKRLNATAKGPIDELTLNPSHGAIAEDSPSHHSTEHPCKRAPEV
jgi:hypothetical protein